MATFDRYWKFRARSLDRRLRERSLKLNVAEQEIASLRAQLELVTEPDDRPLWRRIANQRHALRVSNFWLEHYLGKFYDGIELERQRLKIGL